MPNAENIERPIVIVGAGRAGTTWLLSLVWRHPEIQAMVDNTLIGAVYRETYSKWWAKAFLKAQCGMDEAVRDETVIAGLRALLLTMFPSERPHWLMKSIWDSTKEVLGGVPNEFRTKLFPQACYLHMVRSPLTGLPSMMEYFGPRGRMQTLEQAEDAYNSAHRDALRMRDAGVPYLMLRQEDLRTDPEGAWRKVEALAGLGRWDIPEDLLGREVNASQSMVGKVRSGRDPLGWDEVSEETRAVAQELGYR